jgi:Flp pilus assembly protein TadG
MVEMRTLRKSERGSAMVEFTLSSIPLMFVIVSILGMGIVMWNYHTLAKAVKITAREASSHGAGCVGKSCAWTVGTAATMLSAQAIGVPVGKVNVTFTSAGLTQTCNPLSACTGSSAAWPSLAANVAGSTDVSITASYTPLAAIRMFTLKGAANFASVTLAANSRQLVVY